jgi:hypothetical protein
VALDAGVFVVGADKLGESIRVAGGAAVREPEHVLDDVHMAHGHDQPSCRNYLRSGHSHKMTVAVK